MTADAVVTNGSEDKMARKSTDGKMAAIAHVFSAVQGHWLSACLRVMLELRVADELSSREEPLGIQELAAAAGVQKQGVGHLYKVLRVLAQYELLDELPDKRFAANAATRELVRGEAPSLGHLAAHLVNAPKWEAWNQLPAAVRSGDIAFARAHGGQDVYQYGERDDQGEFAHEFCQAMTYFTQHSLEGGATTLQEAFDWCECRVIMDVGGGRGELLSHCLSYAGSQAKGILFDRDFVIKSVDVPKTFEAKGVAKDRLTFQVGDVREPFPEAVAKAGVDALVMKHFLSAFSDDDARLIVRHCGDVLAPDGKILLLQTLVPEAGDRGHNTCEDGVAPGLFAIEILCQCPGGAWRTLSEWQDIFGSQGFGLAANTRVGCNMNLMVFSKREA